jgi:precorrin-3B methylase
LNASFDLALDAARAAAGMQHYPESALYVVATPIGNLADISLRALQVLQLVDAIACEDKRHSQPLLRQYGIDKPLLAVHEHNEAQAAGLVIERLQRGERVAYVSDAGTPAVSDPGARLVAAVRAAGLTVMPLPGASSVTTVLSVAGLGTPAAKRVLCLPVSCRARPASATRPLPRCRPMPAPSSSWKHRTASRHWRAPWPCWENASSPWAAS